MREINNLMAMLADAKISVAPDFTDKITLFTGFFTETSKTLNLTAIKEPHDIMIKHYFDSLYPLSLGLIPQSARVIDIGCGGGFPSMPLKIARPDLSMLMLDSLKKRLTFLDNACQLTGLSDIKTLHARAEEAGRDRTLRESFDIAVSRAVAPLGLLCEYCLPFVKVGGSFIAYKGTPDDAELSDAVNASRLLGGGKPEIIRYSLPENTGARCLVIIKKLSHTSDTFPRPARLLSKKAK